MKYDIDKLRRSFEEDGYFLVEDFLSKDEIEAALRDCHELLKKTTYKPNSVERRFFAVESYKFKPESPALDAIRDKPELHEMMRGVLGDQCRYCTRLMQVYMPHMGHLQAWHQDSDFFDLPFFYVNCIPYLQDQMREAGLTRVVPGSHKIPIEKSFPDHLDLPGQIAIEVPAGTFACFNALTWHSATENCGDEPRFIYDVRFTLEPFLNMSDKKVWGRARFSAGYRRSGVPILDHPNDEASYPWPERYTTKELEELLCGKKRST